MKAKQLLLTIALLIAATLGQAQSTYKWSTDNWKYVTGSGTAEGGTFTTTNINWGCIQLQTKDEAFFKLPKRQTFIVVKGTNLRVGTSNPNIADLNGTSYQQSFKGGKFAANDANTMLYADVTELIQNLEPDFFGNVTIESLKLTLDAADDYKPSISSIDFVAADLLDGASSVTIYKSDDEALTSVEGDFKKALTFTPSNAGNDMGIVFNTNQMLNNSDMFLVIESDNASLNTSSRIKLRNLSVNGTQYSNNSGGCYVAAKEISAGHYLYVHSFYKGSDTSANLLAQWETTPTMNVTNGTLYINSSGLNDTPIKIYRLGFYNLSEIMNLYDLSSQKWWYTQSNEGKLDVEIHNAATENQIRVNGNYGTASTNTTAYAAQLVRSMGCLPSNFTTISLNGKLSFVTDVTPSTVDIFAELPSTVTTINLDEPEVINLPTTNPNVYLSGQKYFAFKEGSNVIPSQLGTSGGNWSSLTRSLKAGYNSLCVPFNKLQVEKLSSGLSAYELSAFDEETGTITFKKLESNVTTNTKNTPYIVYAENAGTYVFLGRDPQTESMPEYSEVKKGNLKFVGSFVNKVPDGSYAAGENVVNYGITADGENLARMKSTTKTTYYRAFISDQRASASVKGLTVNFDEDGIVTKIENPEEVLGVETAGSEVYNLSGVRMSNRNLLKGIYVRNGKKFVVK